MKDIIITSVKEKYGDMTIEKALEILEQNTSNMYKKHRKALTEYDYAFIVLKNKIDH